MEVNEIFKKDVEVIPSIYSITAHDDKYIWKLLLVPAEELHYFYISVKLIY